MYLAMLGAPDLLVVMAVALVVFGPKRLPEVGKQLGSFMREVRKTMGQFTDEFEGVKTSVTSTVRPDDFWKNSTAKFNEQNHLALDQTLPSADADLMKPYTPPQKPMISSTSEHLIADPGTISEEPVLHVEVSQAPTVQVK